MRIQKNLKPTIIIHADGESPGSLREENGRRSPKTVKMSKSRQVE